MIYKIFRPEEWASLRAIGTTTGAPIDIQDGYIHFSTAEQVAETAAKHFTSETRIILAAVDDRHLGDALKWEPSRGGADFPHLYRALALSDVAEHHELIRTPDGFVFPAGLT